MMQTSTQINTVQPETVSTTTLPDPMETLLMSEKLAWTKTFQEKYHMSVTQHTRIKRSEISAQVPAIFLPSHPDDTLSPATSTVSTPTKTARSGSSTQWSTPTKSVKTSTSTPTSTSSPTSTSPTVQVLSTQNAVDKTLGMSVTSPHVDQTSPVRSEAVQPERSRRGAIEAIDDEATWLEKLSQGGDREAKPLVFLMGLWQASLRNTSHGCALGTARMIQVAHLKKTAGSRDNNEGHESIVAHFVDDQGTFVTVQFHRRYDLPKEDVSAGIKEFFIVFSKAEVAAQDRVKVKVSKNEPEAVEDLADREKLRLTMKVVFTEGQRTLDLLGFLQVVTEVSAWYPKYRLPTQNCYLSSRSVIGFIARRVLNDTTSPQGPGAVFVSGGDGGGLVRITNPAELEAGVGTYLTVDLPELEHDARSREKMVMACQRVWPRIKRMYVLAWKHRFIQKYWWLAGQLDEVFPSLYRELPVQVIAPAAPAELQDPIVALGNGGSPPVAPPAGPSSAGKRNTWSGYTPPGTLD